MDTFSRAIAGALLLGLLLAGCAGAPVATEKAVVGEGAGTAEAVNNLASSPRPGELASELDPAVAKAQAPPEAAPAAPVVEPVFLPVKEDLSPLHQRIINISVRSTPFRDVVKVIADAASLNLVLEKGVNTEVPVTITLNNVTVQDALDIVFQSVDYFYEVRKNLLLVKAQETRMFEFGHPSITNNFTLNLGGDILGAASSGSGGASNIKGEVKMEGKSDDKAKNLWDDLEKSLTNLVKGGDTTAAGSFSINRMSGTIIVTASKKTLTEVDEYLTAVRQSLSRQVMIEARIVEVQLSDSLRYGIDWSLIDSWKGVGTISASTNKFTAIVPSTGPSFDLGLTTSNFTSLLKALQSQGDIRVLSNPRVSLMNGQSALLSVGRNTNFVSKVATTTTASTGTIPQTTFTIETSSVLSGLMLGIVPYINADGGVSLTITPIISDLISLENKDLGTIGENNISISLPTVDLREMSTTVHVKDGQLVVIGGLISRKESLRDNGIPFISRIPLLGYLFKSREKVEERNELVIILRPKVSTTEI
ncbi:MAG TPA: pilus (MSHA type) biogenesis protein MshL [Geobacterales bacterium]|nr:pilus (MSHA type) biogenesis protein MshL [Geobacterales bacterium]